LRTYTNYLSDYQSLSQNSSSQNQTFGMKLVNDALRYLVGTFFFNEASYTVPGGSIASQPGYTLPFNNKQVINTTVLIGSVLWQPRECATRKQYDALNVISFTNDFPQFYYIYNNQLLLWPAPTTGALAITINYKKRIRDLSVADYTTGTVSVTTATTTVTGSGTSWKTNMANRWINIPLTSSDTTSGDDEWYQIASVASATSLTLNNPYTGQTVSGGTHIIGEVSILPEDFQDLPLYRALYIYFNTIGSAQPNAVARANEFKSLYDEGYKRLDAEFGSKTSSVGITPQDYPVINPNMFQNNITG
jgi:hypothetical protein